MADPMKNSAILALTVLINIFSYAQEIPDQSMMMARSPASFRATFKTTKGDFTVEVIRVWSPLAADRLYQLLKTGFYNNNSLFRVQPGYVVQFGIGDKREVNNYWEKHPIPDEPVNASNLKGVISYARDGLNSRTSQLFINLKDNYKLDTIAFNGLRGFPPVGKITSGFEAVESFFSGYGFEPANHQDSVMIYGNQYLKKLFPKLDYIIDASIISE